MNVARAPISKAKIGSCPHGLPAGACPICSGAGGGGGGSSKASKPGEWSFDQCYSVWQQMLRAKQHTADAKHEAQVQAQISLAQKMQESSQRIANLSQKLSDFVQSSKALPILGKPLILAAKIAIPILNVLKNIPLVAQKAITFVQEKMANITDKLAAVFGELKNSTEKKISDKLKDFKKKFKSLFGILETSETEKDEENKIEEEKRIFEEKTAFHSIKEHLLKQKELGYEHQQN